MQWASSPDGAVNLVYEDRGLLAESTNPMARTTFTYDQDGRLISRKELVNGVTRTHTFTWTTRNELWTHVDPVTNTTATYQWNPAGQVTRVDWTNGNYRAFAYSVFGQVSIDHTRRADQSTVAYSSYVYDSRGDVKEEYTYTHNVGWREHGYTYDAGGRLSVWDVTDQPDTITYSRSTYAYDKVGNRKREVAVTGTTTVTKLWAYNERNQLLSGPGATYVWKARGVMDRQTVGGVITTYTYDSLGRMTSSVAGVVQLFYWYDSFDRLALHRKGPAGSAIQKFAYPGTQQGTIGTYGNGPTIAYGRTPGGRLSSLHHVTTANPAGDRRIALLNRHGDLETLFPAAGGLPTEAIRYSPFGEIYARWGADPDPELGFQGQYTNPTSGDVLMQARWYTPGTATFRSRDTYAGDLNTPVSLNRYTYAGNNPVRYWDPTGRCFEGLGERCTPAQIKAATPLWSQGFTPKPKPPAADRQGGPIGAPAPQHYSFRAPSTQRTREAPASQQEVPVIHLQTRSVVDAVLQTDFGHVLFSPITTVPDLVESAKDDPVQFGKLLIEGAGCSVTTVGHALRSAHKTRSASTRALAKTASPHTSPYSSSKRSARAGPGAPDKSLG